MNVFEYNSYKDFLSNYVKHAERRGVISELARIAGCTQSYLSQVLNGKPDLTPDQAWALTEHLFTTKDESDYFFMLVLLGRSISSKLKKNLEAKLREVQSNQFRTSKIAAKTTDSQIQSDLQHFYYHQWSLGAVHTLTASENYQTVDILAKRLSLSPVEIEEHLNWLAKNKLVKKVGNRFIHSGHSFHLPTESIMNQINHLNWRIRSIQNSSKSDEIHYTSTFTISKDDWDELRSNLLKFIDVQRKKIQESGSEEGYAFCCDLFKV